MSNDRSEKDRMVPRKDPAEKEGEMVQEELFPTDENTFPTDEEVQTDGKITLGALNIITPTLTKVFNASLPVKDAYKISKAIDRLNVELKKVEEHRVNLVKKHGKKDENKNMTVVPENMEAFSKEFQELMNIEVEDFQPVPMSFATLEDSKIELTPIEVNNLIGLGFLEEPIFEDG